MMQRRTALVGLVLLAVAFAGCAAPSKPDLQLSASEETLGSACFAVTVTIGNGPVSFGGPRSASTTMRASHFAPSQPLGIAVLLVPGGLADQTAWDGYSAGFGQAEGETLPRRLAAAGFDVFAIDRLGYPNSPLDGVSGFEIHPTADIEALEQVVGHLREGTYDDACQSETGQAATGFRHVLAGGFSHGAFLVADILAGRNVTLDAAFLLSFSIYPAPRQSDALAALCTARHGDFQRHYVAHFCDDFVPAFPSCVDWMAEAPRRDEALTAAACADIQATREPIGLAIGPDRGPDYADRPARMQAVPVYFLNGEGDRVLGHGDGGFEAGRGWQTMFARLHAECTCRPTTVELAGSGHMMLLDRDAVEHMEALLAWLDSNGFGSRAS